MQSESADKFLKKKYIAYIGGPILFTAPHSKRLNRGNLKYGENISIHERQLYTAWIAAKLATLTSLGANKKPNSFLVWGKSTVVDEKDMDPNYLFSDMLADSPFHQSLHHWALKSGKTPILHVDVHGKLNRETNCQVDVGIKSIQIHWEEDPLIKAFKPFFEEKFSKIFEGLKFRDFKCTFNTSPSLHGYWGGGMKTMTEQAIILGIPSFQLEIPMEVRNALFKKPDLMKNFANGIKQFYLKTIVPYFEIRKRQLKISKQISDKFVTTVKNPIQLEQAEKQIAKMEEQFQKNTNLKNN